MVAHLESVGYERREPVEMVGEYSVRGGILDVFSPEAAKPVRVDLFGDLIESIRRFEVESQRSIMKLEDALLLPLTEYQKSRALLAELAELLQESGVPVRDLPPPGETFPGWELLVPMVGRAATPCSRCSTGRCSSSTSLRKSAAPPNVCGSGSNNPCHSGLRSRAVILPSG